MKGTTGDKWCVVASMEERHFCFLKVFWNILVYCANNNINNWCNYYRNISCTFAFIDYITSSLLLKFHYASQLTVVLNWTVYNVALYWFENTDLRKHISPHHPSLCVWRHGCCHLCSPGQSCVYTHTIVENISTFPDWQGLDLLTRGLCWPLFIHVFCFQKPPFGVFLPASDMH